MFDCKEVVKLIDYSENEDQITLYMEYINGSNYLQHKLEERHREIKNESKIKRFAKSVLTGLRKMHEMNIIHADLKIHNILVSRPTKEEKLAGKMSEALLCDFGISQVITSDLFDGKKKAIMKERSGTVGYIAPEI